MRRAAMASRLASVAPLATFPGENNLSALIFELARAGLIDLWVSPAILTEYSDVLGDHPECVAEIISISRVCHPLTELSVIRHEPDNRFLECALVADANVIVTVNTAAGHFDQRTYQEVRASSAGDQPDTFLAPKASAIAARCCSVRPSNLLSSYY